MFDIKRNYFIIFIILLLFNACDKNTEIVDKKIKVDMNTKGGVPNKIIFTSINSSEEGFDSIKSNKGDLLLLNSESFNYKENNKVDVYKTPVLWSLLVNPASTNDFNPFSNREIRFALNSLINREYLVKDILKGDGVINFSSSIINTPNAWRFEVADKFLGLSNSGNEKDAITIINNVLLNISNSSENKGKLIKKNNKWYFNNKIVNIKLVFDKNSISEKKFIDYFGKTLEKIGFSVEKKAVSVEEAQNIIYNTNPYENKWSIYLEKNKEASSEHDKLETILKSRTTLYNNMPGWGNKNWWNYENNESKILAEKLLLGKIKNSNEYWDTLKTIEKIGFKEAIRINLISTYELNFSNKKNLNEKLIYDIQKGINGISLENAYTKNGDLNVLVNKINFSNKSWKFFNNYSRIVESDNLIFSLLFNKEIFSNPYGQRTEKGITVLSTSLNPKFEQTNGVTNSVTGGEIVSNSAIPKNSIGAVESSYKFNFGVWHHGRKVKYTDYLYAESFRKEYLQSNISYYSEFFSKVDSKYNNDGTLTTWSNNYFPFEGLNNIGVFPSLNISNNPNASIVIPWEIVEAIKFNNPNPINEFDFLDKNNSVNIKNSLQKMINEKYIPKELIGKVSLNETIENYKLAIGFIEKYHHIIIGNGPYVLKSIGRDNLELEAIRDKRYFDEKGKWADLFRGARLKINSVIIPDSAETGRPLDITINTSQLNFPVDSKSESRSGTITATFINQKEEIVFNAINVDNGVFVVNIPEELASSLYGEYFVVITASLDGKYFDNSIHKISFK